VSGSRSTAARQDRPTGRRRRPGGRPMMSARCGACSRPGPRAAPAGPAASRGALLGALGVVAPALGRRHPGTVVGACDESCTSAGTVATPWWWRFAESRVLAPTVRGGPVGEDRQSPACHRPRPQLSLPALSLPALSLPALSLPALSPPGDSNTGGDVLLVGLQGRGTWALMTASARL